MAKPATSTADKPKRAVNSDLVLYLIGPAEAVNGVVSIEKDPRKVLDAQNAATEAGTSVISRRFVIKRARRGAGAGAGAGAAAA